MADIKANWLHKGRGSAIPAQLCFLATFLHHSMIYYQNSNRVNNWYDPPIWHLIYHLEKAEENIVLLQISNAEYPAPIRFLSNWVLCEIMCVWSQITIFPLVSHWFSLFLGTPLDNVVINRFLREGQNSLVWHEMKPWNAVSSYCQWSLHSYTVPIKSFKYLTCFPRIKCKPNNS